MSRATPGNERVLCVLNPQSGDGEAARRWPPVYRLLAEAGIDCRVVEITRDRLAADLREALAGPPCTVILGFGGDGTHQAVLNALMTVTAADPSLKLPPYMTVPLGTGNNVAKSLGTMPLRKHPERLPAAIRDGADRQLDLGLFEGTCFADALSIGLDARIVNERSELLQRLSPALRRSAHGYAVYAAAALRALWHTPPAQCEIIADGETWYCGPYANILLNNTRVYGGVFEPTPAGADDDGKLDLAVVTRRLAYVRFCAASWRFGPRFLRGRGRQRQVERCRILLEPPAPVQVDGEYVDVRHQVDIAIAPRAVTIRCPGRTVPSGTRIS